MYCLNDHFKTRNFQNFFIESNMILHIYTESQILLIALWGNFEKKKKKTTTRKTMFVLKNLRWTMVKLGEGNGTPLQYSCLENPMDGGAWKAAVHGVAEGRTRLSDFTFTFHFHALEKEMATHSGVLAWRIQGTGEPGGLPSMGSHRVGHDWSDLAAAAAAAWWNCLLQAISQENKS